MEMDRDLETLRDLTNVSEQLLTGPFLTGWEVPEVVHLEKDETGEHGLEYWWTTEGPHRPSSKKIARPEEFGLAGEFKQLEEAEEILVFAQQWGVLRTCEHTTRRWREDGCYSSKGKSRFEGLWEPIDVWRRYSRTVDMLLRMNTWLRHGELVGDRKHWRRVFPPSLPLGEGFEIDWVYYQRYERWPKLTDLEIQRLRFREILDKWISYIELRPRLVWNPHESRPRLTLAEGSLLESVMAHTIFAITGTRNFESCSSCGRLFTLNRLPSTGDRRYCPECRSRGAPARDASRDYRRRVKDGITKVTEDEFGKAR